ncbi:MAG TPA: STAS domain-containing protein [Acidimicrobiia bacterium]|nr:STAS domain-containing protein [Acidimicrobiia bacterium]
MEHGEHSNPDGRDLDDHHRAQAHAPRLRVTITRSAEELVVGLDGELDLYCASDARFQIDEAIERAVAHEIGRIVVDAGHLQFCDSTGLSALVRAADAAATRDITLFVRELSPPMRELLRITGLDALVEQ